MFCSKCGREIVADAKFCLNCGAPVSQSQRPQIIDEWEHCEIEVELVKKGIWPTVWWIIRFWARAIGKNGIYSAGTTQNLKIGGGWLTPGWNPPFGYTDKEQQITRVAYENLIQMLIKNGWEHTGGRGPENWQLQFKRRVTG